MGIAYSLIQTVVFMQNIVKKRLPHGLRIDMLGTYGIHKIGIMQIYTGRLTREFFIDRIQHIDETGIFQVLDIIDDRSARRLDFLAQLAHVW